MSVKKFSHDGFGVASQVSWSPMSNF